MGKSRLEAFSDGVLAIIITIMVLELKAPIGHNLPGLDDLFWKKLLAYMLSFIYIGIFWNNHHHLWHAASKVGGAVMWANLHMLFWLSLVPLATDWIGETDFATVPVAVYGLLLLMAAIAFTIMVRAMIRLHGKDSLLAKAVGRDLKGKVSMLLYAVGIALTFLHPWIGLACYAAVSVIWFVPDRRIEDRVNTAAPPVQGDG